MFIVLYVLCVHCFMDRLKMVQVEGSLTFIVLYMYVRALCAVFHGALEEGAGGGQPHVRGTSGHIRQLGRAVLREFRSFRSCFSPL